MQRRYFIFKAFKKSLISLTLFVLLLLLTCQYIEGAKASQLIEKQGELEKLFHKADYASAISLIQEAPESSFRYFFQLGTFFLYLENFLEAKKNLELAALLEPKNPFVISNLNLAKQALPETELSLLESPSSQAWERFRTHFALNEFFCLVSLLILVSSYSFHQALKQKCLPSKRIWHSLGFFMLSISIGLLTTERWYKAHPNAIVCAPQVVRTGPSESYLSFREIPLGLKVRVLKNKITRDPSTTGWTQIRFGKNQIGWVQTESLFPFQRS